MMRSVIMAFVLIIPVLTQAAGSSSTENLGHQAYKGKQYPFPTLEFVVASEQTKDQETHKSDGSYSKIDASLLYSLNKDNDLRLFGSAIYQSFDNPEYKDKATWDLTEFMYRRKNILTQSKFGVNMDLELKNYYLIDEEVRKLYGYDGAFIPQIIFKRHFSRSFVTEFAARHHFYFKNNGKKSTSSGETRLYLTPTYVLTRSLFLSSTFKYRHKIKTDKYFSYRYFKEMPKKTDHLIVHPGLMYLVNRKMLVEGYVETELMTSHDGQAFNENWDKNFVLGAALYLTAF